MMSEPQYPQQPPGQQPYPGQQQPFAEQQAPGAQPQPDQILDRPIVMDDLANELKQNKRGFNKVTVGLIGAVLLIGSFFGGVATHAAIAKPAAAQSNTPRNGTGGYGRQFPGGGQGGTGQNGQGGQNGGGFRGGTAGTVDRVEGNDVYIKTQNGSEIKVSTTDSTQIRISQPGKVADLKQGQLIIVQGQSGSDGSVSAQMITEQPARTTG